MTRRVIRESLPAAVTNFLEELDMYNPSDLDEVMIGLFSSACDPDGDPGFATSALERVLEQRDFEDLRATTTAYTALSDAVISLMPIVNDGELYRKSIMFTVKLITYTMIVITVEPVGILR